MKKINEMEMRNVTGGATYYHCAQHNKKNMSYLGSLLHIVLQGYGCYMSVYTTSKKK